MMSMLNFQWSLSLQSSESHDPSGIILICRFVAQKTEYAVVLLNIFVEPVMHFFFSRFFEYIVQINCILLEIEVSHITL